MSNKNPSQSIHEAPFEDFVASVLPLYVGPLVTVCIGSTSNAYQLPKALLCEQSPYFAATFKGDFKEGESQSTIIEDVDGAVTVRGFQMLVQWLYCGRVIFGDSSSEETITSILEFVRFADMCGVTGMESLMAKRIEGFILSTNYAPCASRSPDANIGSLTLQHLTAAARLPPGHPVRGVFAAVAVKEHFLRNSALIDKAEEYPDFAVDLLKAMKTTLETVSHRKRSITFRDPLSGEELELRVYAFG